MNTENHEEDIFQALENRQDLEFSHPYPHPLPIQSLDKEKLSRVDYINNNNQFDDTTNKDPLYIVHFVPSPKPKVESSTQDPTVVSTVSSEVLQKILSASKGAKPGTPQFVVFAPLPGEEGAKNGAGTLDIGSQGINLFSNQHPSAQMDYDYETELKKYQQLTESKENSPPKDIGGVDYPTEMSELSPENLKETVRLLVQNLTARNVYQSEQQQSVLSNSNIFQHISDLNNLPVAQQSQIVPQLNYDQQSLPGYAQETASQGYANNAAVQEYSSQGSIQGFANQVGSQGYANPVSSPGYINQVSSPGYTNQVASQRYSNQVPQQINYDQQQQSYYPQQEASNTNNQYLPQQPNAVERSGHYEPVGIRLNLGKGLFGLHSPLGIIGSILKPLLPRPQLNLNGKVMFGVMLENGLKLGANKGHHGPHG